jgi:HAMP domain-containing protein
MRYKIRSPFATADEQRRHGEDGHCSRLGHGCGKAGESLLIGGTDRKDLARVACVKVAREADEVGDAACQVDSSEPDVFERPPQAAGRSSAESTREELERNDELGELAATFDGMLDRLESAFQRQRQFTADASHELPAGQPSAISAQHLLSSPPPRNPIAAAAASPLLWIGLAILLLAFFATAFL